MQQPTDLHFQALRHTLHYAASTSRQGILLQVSNTLKVHAFNDSNWGTCLDTRRQLQGMSFYLVIPP